MTTVQINILEYNMFKINNKGYIKVYGPNFKRIYGPDFKVGDSVSLDVWSISMDKPIGLHVDAEVIKINYCRLIDFYELEICVKN